MKRPLPSGICLLALTFGTILAVCWIPYHIPMTPTVSESYIFGYNNRAGQLVLVAGLFLIGLLGVDVSGRPVPSKPLRDSTLHKALGGTLAVAGTLFFLTRRLGGFDESIYFMDRVNLLLEGRTPYKGFEFVYGPAYLYGPAWMSRGLHLGANDAYLLFWLLLALAGTYLLYKTVVWVDEPPGRQRSIFLFLWVISLAALLNTGLNYCLFRFILPCYFGVLVYRRLKKAEEGNGSRIGAFLLPAPLLAGVLLISPELGVGFAVGTAAYLGWFGRLRGAKNLLWFGLMLAAMVGILWVAARSGLFLTAMNFRKGGMNFPVMAAPHLLLFFFCLGVAACYVGQRLRGGQPSALLMLICVSAVDVASALGRCDAGHVLMDPLGIWIAAFFVASGLPAVWRYLWPATWLVFFVIPIGPGMMKAGSMLFKAALPAALAREPANQTTSLDRWVLGRMTEALGPAAAAEKFANIKALAHSRETVDLPTVFHEPAGTVFEAPFGFAPTRFGLYHTPSLDEGYFFEGYHIVVPSAVRRKIAEMAGHPDRPLLLLPEWQSYCVVNGAASRSLLRHLFLYPYDRPVAHSYNLDEPICDYIEQHYREQAPASPNHFGYELWAPK